MNTEVKKLTRFAELDHFAHLLKENGYTVIVCERKDNDLPTWLHFYKNGGMGYVQLDKYGRASFSIQYKPSREHGTGCGITDEFADLTLKNAEKATSNRLPNWFYSRNSKPIQLWRSAEEFISKNTILKYYIL
jgi:hypothetical protein